MGEKEGVLKIIIYFLSKWKKRDLAWKEQTGNTEDMSVDVLTYWDSRPDQHPIF